MLVVSDSDTIAPADRRAARQQAPPGVRPDEFDEVYIVITIPWYGKVKTLRLHYGELPSPS